MSDPIYQEKSPIATREEKLRLLKLKYRTVRSAEISDAEIQDLLIANHLLQDAVHEQQTMLMAVINTINEKSAMDRHESIFGALQMHYAEIGKKRAAFQYMTEGPA